MVAKSSNRILICLRYGIGDLVMELPALRELRAQLPHAHLTALGAAPAVELLKDNSDFDAVFPVQSFGFQHWGDQGTAAARRRLAKWLIAGKFEWVLDAAHAAIGVRETISALSLPVLNTGNSVEINNGGPIAGRGVRSLWRSIGRIWDQAETEGEPVPHLYIPEAARRTAEQFFSQQGLANHEVVGIAPIASSKLKRWPLERLDEVMRWLICVQNKHLLVFSAPGEDRAVREWLKGVAQPERVELVPPLHLQQTAAMISRCRAFLSNDTGLMHIAAAVDTPTVAVFGPTSPSVYLPPGAFAVSSEIECMHRATNQFGPSPCLLHNRCLIGPSSCISTILVESVTAMFARVLSRSFTHPSLEKEKV
jgi:ADP-heptose:LPS heptosyltransferase